MTKAGGTKPDLSEFRQVQGQRNQCGVMRAAMALTEDAANPDRPAKLAAALTEGDISHMAIVRVLKDWGHAVSNDSVSNHRRGLCQCHAAKS